ncbi:TetR/AcrR family transcriptional regulator [Falsibacillus albus]|uniref:TetR/AcrR family transcriptional regulator n=1 Tax=Falsibacillus albus TaxID=2478915 RepID=A0A3L7JZ83_9BACI|nr:TetR/AcrR family transcriptional regulator [Falsibacillus albus]RLQ95439.1 TetR/AcrR family transcriptional regulator [Falsibacillus albus]
MGQPFLDGIFNFAIMRMIKVAPIVSREYKEKMKKKIMETAFLCFAEKGFQVATMDDIVKNSGMSKGAIYNYFKSKDDIYIALMEERTKTSIGQLKDKLSAIPSAKKQMEFLLNVYSLQAEKNPEWQNNIRVHIEFWLQSSRDEKLKLLLEKRMKEIYQQLIFDILEEGKRTGEFSKSLDSTLISILFWSIIDGISTYYGVMKDDYPYRKVMEKAGEMILKEINHKSEYHKEDI